MAKRKRRRLKRIYFYLLIIINVILILVILSLEFRPKRSNKVSKVVKSNEFSSVSGYKKENLDKYKEYKKNNKDASDKVVVNLINNGIDIKYSKDIDSLMDCKYFIIGKLERYLKQGNTCDVISLVNSDSDLTAYKDTEKTDTSKNELMLVNKYHYLTDKYQPDDLITLDQRYNVGTNNKMRKVAYDAFKKMSDDASKDGISIRNASGYRSYEYQVTLYNNYVARDGKVAADTYSARPGFSEHQTGYVSDINIIDNSFEKTDAFRWLSDNAYKYGFILRFPKGKEKITGYEYESWHYRYVGLDAAKVIHDNNLTLEEYYAYYVEK